MRTGGKREGGGEQHFGAYRGLSKKKAVSCTGGPGPLNRNNCCRGQRKVGEGGKYSSPGGKKAVNGRGNTESAEANKKGR